MKKIIVALSLGLFTSTALFAQAASNNVPDGNQLVAPEALIVNKAEFDFGKIPQGKPVTTVFEVTNTSKTAFKLENVQASCGCTTPQWDKDAEIAPGATAKITVGYNAAAEGPFNRSITIHYNGNQSKVVNIKGEVWSTPATSAPANDKVNSLKN